MAKNQFDARIPLPPIDGAEYEDKDIKVAEESEIIVVEAPGNPPPTDILFPPFGVVIVEQLVRTAEDGSRIVDVVFEVDEMSGVSSYEARVSKIDY